MNSHPIRKPWGQRLWLTALHAGGVPAARPARGQSLAWGWCSESSGWRRYGGA